MIRLNLPPRAVLMLFYSYFTSTRLPHVNNKASVLSPCMRAHHEFYIAKHEWMNDDRTDIGNVKLFDGTTKEKWKVASGRQCRYN